MTYLSIPRTDCAKTLSSPQAFCSSTTFAFERIFVLKNHVVVESPGLCAYTDSTFPLKPAFPLDPLEALPLPGPPYSALLQALHPCLLVEALRPCHTVERPSRTRHLSGNFGMGSGEGTLDGPRGGINQHDRVGVNKASGWPGQLHRERRCQLGSHCAHELQINTDTYPALNTRDTVHLDIQPFVKGVTSYSPNRRYQNFQYRNMAQISYLACESGDMRCVDATVVIIGTHSFRPGDAFTFSGVLGADRAQLNNQEFVVDAVSLLGFTTTSARRVDTFSGVPDFDVASSFITKTRTPTAANPKPALGVHEWSYEQGDKIYFFVTLSEPVVVTGTPRLKLNTGSHYEAGANDAYAMFVGGGYGEKKTFWKNNERNPIKMPMEANNWYDDQYHIHDGGCTMGGFQRAGAPNAVSDCNTGGRCDCAQYSGITHEVDAQVGVLTT